MKNIINKIKQLFNNDNKIKLIGILTILVIIWLILYLIPNLFISLFNTLLGNFILLLTTILMLSYNIKYGLGLGLIFIILYRFSHLSRKKEGFTWNKGSENDFILIQDTINPNVVFDINIIKQQASQSELNYFNNNGKWPWSENTIMLYKEAVNKNPFIRNYYEDAIDNAMTIYNESAILRILSYQTKEGQFLINGVLVPNPLGNKLEELPSGFGDFAYKSGLAEDRTKDIIKCNISKTTGSNLEKITYTGHDGIYNAQTKKVTPVDYNELENIIPGFKFLNGPCNPCSSMDQPPNYSCPFSLDLKGQQPFISSVWQTLWNI